MIQICFSNLQVAPGMWENCVQHSERLDEVETFITEREPVDHVTDADDWPATLDLSTVTINS
jgi:hypothetical protein